MIQRELNVVQQQGSLQGTEIGMSIDKAAEGLIMERLIRLYEDRIKATIREISTNAFDATVEAAPDRQAVLNGTAGRPIHVTLPTNLAPMFIVRDHGTGMSHDTLTQVYSKYGASTKRHSNDFNGALGFGCKAPLAYSVAFSVQTVRDGLRNVLQVGRTPSGGGKLTLVEENAPTTEPNGTTVIVPVESGHIHEFAEKSRAFFRYWKPGTVLVNDEQPETIDTVMRLNDRFSVVKERDHAIVMAGVSYPLPTYGYDAGLSGGYAMVAEVPTGAVEFTPSREALEISPYTRDALTKLMQEFRDACKGAIQRKINEATTADEAMAAMSHWRRALPRTARPNPERYVWNKRVLPVAWEEKRQMGQDWPFVSVAVNSYGSESAHHFLEKIEAESFPTVAFITGFGSIKFTANHKRRLMMWLNETCPSVTSFVLVRGDEIPREVRQWIRRERIVSWSHIKANYKLPTNHSGAAGSRKALAGSYDDVWVEDSTSGNGAKWIGETMASSIRQDKPIYYFTTQTHHGVSMIEMAPLASQEFTVVKLPMNRVSKFLRDFPAATPLRSVAEAAYDKWAASITQDVKQAITLHEELRYNGGAKNTLEKLDPALIDDPALKHVIKLTKIDLTGLFSRGRLFSRVLGKGVPKGINFDVSVVDSYPLLAAARSARTAIDHAYIYVNAVYAAKNS